MMHIKYLATVMILGAVISEDHVMPSYIFPQALRINAAGYTNVIKMVVKP